MTCRKNHSGIAKAGISLGIGILLSAGCAAVAQAQDHYAVTQRPGKRTVVSVKTNLLYDALLSPSLGVEVGLSPKFTLDAGGSLNLWRVDGRSWKHWQVQPELRYWLCQRLAGHFVGIEAHAGQFNVGNIGFDLDFLGTDFGKLRSRRYQGWQWGAGLTYGYAWVISEHWNVEAELGLGYSYTTYDSYPCANCGTKLESKKRHDYVGVTKAQVGVGYVF